MLHHKQKQTKTTEKNKKQTKNKNPQHNLNSACASVIYLLRYSHFLRQTWIW